MTRHVTRSTQWDENDAASSSLCSKVPTKTSETEQPSPVQLSFVPRILTQEELAYVGRGKKICPQCKEVVGSAKKKCPMCKIHFVAKFSPQKEGTIGKGRKLCHICTTKMKSAARKCPTCGASAMNPKVGDKRKQKHDGISFDDSFPPVPTTNVLQECSTSGYSSSHVDSILDSSTETTSLPRHPLEISLPRSIPPIDPINNLYLPNLNLWMKMMEQTSFAEPFLPPLENPPLTRSTSALLADPDLSVWETDDSFTLPGIPALLPEYLTRSSVSLPYFQDLLDSVDYNYPGNSTNLLLNSSQYNCFSEQDGSPEHTINNET